MVKVASWRARGPFAGQVVKFREAKGPQLWRVVAKYEKPAAEGVEKLEQTFISKQKCLLAEMHQTVMQELAQDVADGEMVLDASLEFYVKGRI